MLLKSPTDDPIQVVLLSGHSIVIGPDAREVHERFISPAIAAGAVVVEPPAKPAKLSKPKLPPDPPPVDPDANGDTSAGESGPPNDAG